MTTLTTFLDALNAGSTVSGDLSLEGTSLVRALALAAVSAGTTGNRPSAVVVGAGGQYYDTTLSKPIWSDGTVWRDSAGTGV
jgi:hypothetical protein